MIDFFRTTVYEPLLNGLFFFLSIVPGADVGVAVILLTILVKVFLVGVSHKSTVAMRRMQELQPEFQKIKARRLPREEEARAMLALYKQHNINPLASLGGLVVILIQIPIIISLYYVFIKGLAVPTGHLLDAAGRIPSELLSIKELYSFTPVPEFIHVKFLGLIDLTGKSIILAMIVAATQYVLGGFLAAKNTATSDFAKSWQFQMKYMFPVLLGVISYTISAAVALYFLAGNLVSIIYEYRLRKKEQ